MRDKKEKEGNFLKKSVIDIPKILFYTLYKFIFLFKYRKFRM